MDRDRRDRLAGFLRLIAGIALVVLALAFFYQPLRLFLGPRAAGAYYGLGVHKLFQGAAAPGFVLQITSDPTGATVLVDGDPRGKTPALANVACRDGQEITLVVRMPGFPDFRQVVTCREGQTLKARIRMGD